MCKNALTVIFTCCALATVAGQVASPAPQGPQSRDPQKTDAKPAPRPPFKWWAIDKYKQELKLTAEQSAEIEKIFQASMERLRVDKDDFDRAQTGFSQIMDKASAGDREFARAIDQLELARYNVSKERTVMLVRIHSVLTPEQRKGLEAIRKRNEGDRNRQH
jgi:Spy/CpxP family protein refolding chaperone